MNQNRERETEAHVNKWKVEWMLNRREMKYAQTNEHTHAHAHVCRVSERIMKGTVYQVLNSVRWFPCTFLASADLFFLCIFQFCVAPLTMPFDTYPCKVFKIMKRIYTRYAQHIEYVRAMSRCILLQRSIVRSFVCSFVGSFISLNLCNALELNWFGKPTLIDSYTVS